MTPILDYQHYDHEMAKAMMDKLFFLDKVDATTFVDFGCADGEMFERIQNLFPKAGFTYFGYDMDPEMIAAAKARHIRGSYFSTDLEEIKKLVSQEKEFMGSKSCLILSSVIHEIYSYSTQAEIDSFWDFALTTGFDFIAIRDMALNSRELGSWYENEKAAIIRSKVEPYMVKDFEDLWGSMDNFVTAIHFLLKYRYPQNWDREVRENYFPVDYMDYFRKLAGAPGYDLIMDEHFVHPYISKQIQKDFGFEFKEKTHVKFILEKK